MNEEKITPDLLKRFFNKTCSEEERALAERWLADPKNQIKAEKLMLEQWHDDRQIRPSSQWNQHNTLQRIHEKMGRGKAGRQQPVYINRKPRIYRQILKIAAVILLPLVAAGGFWLLNKPLEPSAIAVIEKINPGGQKSSVLLPDGSKVWLNAASALRFPEEFTGSQREVILEGEAFFEVVENKQKPFIVKTRDVDIKVFGTSFNVSAYPDDAFTATAVVTGLVGVRQSRPADTQQDFAFVKPNQLAHFSREERELIIQSTDANELISWKEGRLIFDATPFPVVIKKLQRWYGASITYTGQQLEKELLTFTVTKESLEKILGHMGSLVPLEYQLKENRQVLIHDK